MSRPRHAASLRRLFRHVLAAAIVSPLPVTVMVACSSGTGPLSGIDPDGSSGSSGSSGTIGSCRAAAQIDAPTSCGNYTVPLAGDQDTCEFGDAGQGAYEFCRKVCGGFVSSCARSAAEPKSVQCSSPCAVDGRRYTLLDDRGAPNGDSVGAYLARMAFFEAASVDAFALLQHELALHDAPTSLLRSCRQARKDEVRHARMAASLARRHGAAVVAPPPPVVASARGLEAIAIENAVEGCVRETFGVLLGMWQSHAAPSAALRAFFSAITRDEMRHAALSARIDEWARAQLSEAARRRVDVARAEAMARLEATLLEREPPSGLGLPSSAQVRALWSTWTAASTSMAA